MQIETWCVPFPNGARFQRLLTRDMPVKPLHSGKILNAALQIDQIRMFHVKHSICNPENKRAPGRFPSAPLRMPRTLDGAGVREFQTPQNVHPEAGFHPTAIILQTGHHLWRLGKPAGQ